MSTRIFQYPSYPNWRDLSEGENMPWKPEKEEDRWGHKKSSFLLTENLREVIHDLRNPISCIIGYGQLLAARAVDPETKEDLEKILRQAERASEMVKGLAVFAHRSEEKKENRRQDGMEAMEETHTEGSLNWGKLKEMKDNEAEFSSADGLSTLRIVEMDEKQKRIYLINQTGRITWPLKYQKLEEVHKKVRTGKVALAPHEIDKLVPTWGSIITGLLKYLGCEDGCR